MARATVGCRAASPAASAVFVANPKVAGRRGTRDVLLGGLGKGGAMGSVVNPPPALPPPPRLSLPLLLPLILALALALSRAAGGGDGALK